MALLQEDCKVIFLHETCNFSRHYFVRPSVDKLPQVFFQFLLTVVRLGDMLGAQGVAPFSYGAIWPAIASAAAVVPKRAP